MGVLGLFRGGLLGEPPSDASPDLMGSLFDGREVEVFDLLVGTEDLEGNLLEDLLEAKVGNRAFRRGTKHRESSVTTSSYPDALTRYQKSRDPGIDLFQYPAGGTRAFLHPDPDGRRDCYSQMRGN